MSCYYYCKYCKEYKKKQHNCCKNNSKCNDNKDSLVRASAFRARNTVNQPVPANTFVKVLFQNEQFDLANEYNPTTSIFIPKTKGVYSVIGTIGFFPNDSSLNYRARVEIRVNGNAAIAIDNDFFGPIGFGNVVSVSTIIQLHAGDQVEVYAQSSIDGVLSPSEDGSHFEAARFPSPIK
ncbi:ABC transporter permease [Bacillus anthracis]|nr:MULTISPECIES: ABC transporter permease [Bacillus cereus group]PFC87178.1 ABC transporter permease [Bacillus anthracis]PFT22378.1 ABC transporter permease [Bacillus thuringiensis]KXY80401.1 ABC transporter permease [Bacillus cereus]MBG9838621.1 ABC transporter permease [Bacillus tropicus]MBG9877276.1 ABC transporter permease [Bacillus tropicus]